MQQLSVNSFEATAQPPQPHTIMTEKKAGRKNPKNPKSTLQRIRVRQGLTIEELSRIAKIPKSTINVCESRGYIGYTSVATALATALNVSTDTLLGHQPPPELDLRTANSRMYRLLVQAQTLTQDHRKALANDIEFRIQAFAALEQKNEKSTPKPARSDTQPIAPQ